MIDVNLLNPYARVAMRSVLAKGTVIKTRIIYDYELIYLERGTLTLSFGERIFRCESGQFVFIRPGITHKLDCTETDLSQPHIHFDLIYDAESRFIPVSFKDRPDMTAEELKMIRPDEFYEYPPLPFVSFRDHAAALELFYSVIDLQADDQRLAAKGCLTRLLAMLIKDNFPAVTRRDSISAYGPAGQIKDYVDSTDGVGIDLSSLEKQFSYSRYHLERMFKAKYGIGIIRYASEMRMQRAKELIAEGSVSSVSRELGFSSIYAFSRAFKNRFGYPPSELKRRR